MARALYLSFFSSSFLYAVRIKSLSHSNSHKKETCLILLKCLIKPLIYLEWTSFQPISECSKTCGGGGTWEVSRICRRLNRILEASMCEGEDGQKTEECNTQACPGKIIDQYFLTNNTSRICQIS